MEPKDIISSDSLLADRVRMVIMATLSSAKNPLDFNYMLEHLGLTKGNLSSHIRKLEEAGLVEVHKAFIDRKPRTTYTATKKGKKELLAYLQLVEQLLKMKID